MKRALIVGAIVILANVMIWAHWQRIPLADGAVADRVVVLKGDRRTPEGDYVINFRKPDSDYHRALHVSYPRPGQVTAARARGEPPGGFIMIHGLPNGARLIGRLHLLSDWTIGCIAVTNPEIDEIWRVVPDGTPVEIRP